ncbi:hypothetical protein BX600DRAFT_460600 [Xylariales sp. PMI_506]|nr:hypothetical protein BX600DRAFT_460600 [Xylariales sp. PMI_506]
MAKSGVILRHSILWTVQLFLVPSCCVTTSSPVAVSVCAYGLLSAAICMYAVWNTERSWERLKRGNRRPAVSARAGPCVVHGTKVCIPGTFYSRSCLLAKRQPMAQSRYHIPRTGLTPPSSSCSSSSSTTTPGD